MKFYLNSSFRSPDWRIIERSVPCGISFLAIGKITVAEPLRNFAWLPRCEIKIKPSRWRTLTTLAEESSLGILQVKGLELGVFD